MAQFQEALRGLDPQHRLRNIAGPGELSFDFYWALDVVRQDAVVRFTPHSSLESGHSESFANWGRDGYPGEVERIATRFGFVADGWELVPIN